VAAPGGICVSCGAPMQWCMHRGLLYVRCRYCVDLFGTELASDGVARRREVEEVDDRAFDDLPF